MEIGINFKEAVGEFDENNVNNGWFYVRVFILQITMMNLLIAILSDTFDKVQSSRRAYDRIERL